MNNSYGEAFAETLEIIEHSKKKLKIRFQQNLLNFLRNKKI